MRGEAACPGLQSKCCCWDWCGWRGEEPSPNTTLPADQEKAPGDGTDITEDATGLPARPRGVGTGAASEPALEGTIIRTTDCGQACGDAPVIRSELRVGISLMLSESSVVTEVVAAVVAPSVAVLLVPAAVSAVAEAVAAEGASASSEGAGGVQAVAIAAGDIRCRKFQRTGAELVRTTADESAAWVAEGELPQFGTVGVGAAASCGCGWKGTPGVAPPGATACWSAAGNPGVAAWPRADRATPPGNPCKAAS